MPITTKWRYCTQSKRDVADMDSLHTLCIARILQRGSNSQLNNRAAQAKATGEAQGILRLCSLLTKVGRNKSRANPPLERQWREVNKWHHKIWCWPNVIFVILLLIGAGYMRHTSIEFSWLRCFLEGEGAILTWTSRGLCAIRYPPCIGLEVGHGVAIDNGPYSYFFEEHHLHAASSTFQYFDLVLHWDC